MHAIYMHVVMKKNMSAAVSMGDLSTLISAPIFSSQIQAIRLLEIGPGQFERYLLYWDI